VNNEAERIWQEGAVLSIYLDEMRKGNPIVSPIIADVEHYIYTNALGKESN
jgi:hypothetical protein